MADSPSSSAAWRPSASLEVLRVRAEMLQRLRRFFEVRGFLEVETPLLSADVVVDRHIEPLSVVLPADPHRPAHGRTLWLQTSPEFHMKRLLAAGATALFQVTRSFRAGESGTLHNPEFTIAEWYRAGDGDAEGMTLLSELAETLLARGPAQRLTYAEAFQQFAGIDPHRATAEELAAALEAGGTTAPASLAPGDRDGWLDLLLTERVAPHLGRQRPVILHDFPASQAALARTRRLQDGIDVAERFELFVEGIELANGYHELLDAQLLRQRSRAANVQRAADGARQLPEESQLLTAMEHGLPKASGCALGLDRVVMLAAGCHSLAQVLAFPIDRA